MTGKQFHAWIRQWYPERVAAFKKKRKDAQRKYQQTRKRHANSSRMLRLYGISVEEYDTLLAKQGNVCQVCQRPQSQFRRTFAVDHCHTSGKVRGILCGPCNMALGLLKDNPTIISRLHSYVTGTI